MRAALSSAGLLVAGCTTNPRNEIAGVAAAALAHTVQKMRAPELCVDRVIVPWQPNDQVRRIDTPPPPGMGDLLGPGVFRGGGALRGQRVAGVPVRDAPYCLDLRGPVIKGDRAMVEVHLVPTGWNVWLRKLDGHWQAVATTTSYYPG